MAGNFTAATGADFHYRGTTDGGSPSTGQFVLGDWVETPTGIALCRIGGTPGIWSDFSFTPTGATVPVLPASNGSDDTTALNAVLAAGGRIRGKPGETYLVTAPLVLPSNTELDMTDCTINLIGSNGRLLRNFSLGAAAVRTVADAAITTLTKTLTSATAAFTAADVGRSVSIAGAGAGGAVLNTQIVSRTNSTTVVLDVAATTTVSGASLSLYDRDTNITVRGGTWTRDATASNAHLLVFHRVDRGTFRDLKVVTAQGKYAIYGSDVTKLLATNIDGDSFSAIMQVCGPASKVTIDTVTGKSGDDCVAVTGRDYAAYELTAGGGDITDVVVRNLDVTSTNYTLFHLIAGLNVKCRNVTVDGVRGSAGGQVVGLADDTLDAFTTGQDIDGIYVRDVKGTTTAAGFAQVLIAGVGVKQVVVDGVTITQAANNCTGVLLGATLTAQSVTVRNLEINSTVNHSGIILQSGGVVGNLIVDGYVGILDPTLANGHFATIAGQITGLFSVSNAQQKQGSSFVQHSGSTALVVAANNCWISGTVGFFSAGSAALTILCGAVWSPGSTTFQVTSGSGSLVIIGGPLSAAALFKSGTQNVRINAPTFSVDVLKVNNPTAGDRVYNSNAAAPCGVGLVAYNGTAWVLANTGAVKTGTAVLVAGTVVVADTAITANSIIRLTAKTLGGTAGALFVSARTAATSFAITSTNGADTSTVQYEILAY